MTLTATVPYNIDHLLTALQVIEDMKETPYLTSAVIRDTLMDMGLDMPDATTIECAASVINELGIEI